MTQVTGVEPGVGPDLEPEFEAEDLARRVRSGAIWSGARTILMRFANIAVMAVVARIMAPDDFGVFAVAITVHTIVSSIGELGVSTMLTRGDIDVDEYAGTVATISIVSSAVLGGAMFLFAQPLATALGSERGADPMRVMAIAVLLVGVFAVPGSQLVREFRQDKQFLATVISFVPANVSLLLMAWAGMGAMAFAWSRVLGQLIMGLAICAMVKRNYRPGWRRSTVRPLLLFGLPLAGANLLNYTLLNADYVFVGRFLGEVSLGVYLLAFNIASWSTSLMSAMINGVAMPAFSRVKGDPDGLRSALLRSTRAVALVAAPMATFTVALADPLVETVYGGKWAAAAPVLAILAVYGAVSVICLLLSNVLVGMGRTHLLFVVQLIWLCVLVPAMVAGIELFGLKGAGYAHIVVIALLVFPVYLVTVRRATGVGLGGIAVAVAPPVLAALVGGAVAWGAADLVGPPVVKFLFGGVVGGLVYVLLALRYAEEYLPVRLRAALTPVRGVLVPRRGRHV